MKKVFLKIILITIFMLICIPKVSASIHHQGEFVSGYTDSDGKKVYIHHLMLTVSGSSKVNHLEGRLVLKNLEVLSFEGNSEFLTNFNNSNLTYNMTSNHVFTSKENQFIYATVTVKQISVGECSFSFEPSKTTLENTNQFLIKKEAYQGGQLITKVNAGEEFQYKITVTSNNNILETDNVTVTDVIREELEIINAYEGQVSGNTITWNLGKFKPGTTTKTLYVDVRAKEDSKGDVNNTAILTVGDNTFEDSTPIKILYSDISLTKKSSRNKISPGTEFYYLIEVKNNGTGASKSVTVYDTPNYNLEFISSPNTYQKVGSTYYFNLGSIASGETKTIRINVKAKDNVTDTIIPNTAIATEEGKDPIEDDVDVEIIPKEIKPEISIKKEVNKNEVKPGEEFEYRIKVTNHNELNLINIKLTDDFDPELTLIDIDSGIKNNNSVTWIFDLLPNQTVEFIIKVKVNEDCKKEHIMNKATITYEDEEKPSNEVTVIIPENPKPEPPKPEDSKDPEIPDDPEVDVKNPDTGFNYLFIGLLVVAGLIIYLYAHHRNKIYRI